MTATWNRLRRGLGALAAPFALLALVFSFAFPFVIAFPGLESIATAGLGFWGHIAVLREEMSN